MPLKGSCSFKVSEIILIVGQNERSQDGKVGVLLLGKMMMIMQLRRGSANHAALRRTRGEVREGTS